MAKMYPKKLPEYIRKDPLRSAECEVYDLLEYRLDDELSCFLFQSLAWLTKDGLEIDGEADFTSCSC